MKTMLVGGSHKHTNRHVHSSDLEDAIIKEYKSYLSYEFIKTIIIHIHTWINISRKKGDMKNAHQNLNGKTQTKSQWIYSV